MPFKYGIATMTTLPHVFLQVKCEFDGLVQAGVAADHLPPKWFTKDPSKNTALEIEAMLGVIHQARLHAQALGPAPSVFSFWAGLVERQSVWAQSGGVPPLLAHFGTSLVERAVIDAFCRAYHRPFVAALHSGALGIDLGAIHPSLAGTEPADWLPGSPPTSIFARHTVGLADPLLDEEIVIAERVDDGLPQSLEACIAAYGLQHFKLKVAGAGDLPRLRRIVAILARLRPEGFSCTLDGNEGFHTVAQFREFWAEVAADPPLAPLRSALLFVEQPFHRDLALSDAIGVIATAWPERPPIIIDESDAELTSLPRALHLGYVGTSHKNCKGIFKGVANACLLAQLRHEKPGTRWVFSGEDLTNIGPVALLQDLAVQATLGVTSVERNGHHYFAGLSFWPPGVQAKVRQYHPDLYEDSPAGWPTLRLSGGRLSTRSVLAAPFGVAFEFDPASAAQIVQ